MINNLNMMKKICLLVLMIVLGKISYGQYPISQNLGSDSTIVVSKGALQSRLINVTYTDTSAANLQRIRQYPGAQIATTTGGLNLWIRNANATAWIPVATGSGNNIYTIDGTLLGNRTLSGSGYPLTFTGLDKFVVSADSIRFTTGALNLLLKTDSASISKKLSYAGNYHSDYKQFTLVDKGYVDSVVSSSPAGTVTSIATNNATGITGGTITSTGTLAIDTTNVIATKASVTAGLAGKLNISDTAAMLNPYLRAIDTTSLSNRINLKLNISDTASMLNNYLNNVGYGLSKAGQIVSADSATLSNYYLRRKDSLTATNPLGYVTKQILADTAAAIRSSDLGGTVTSVATNNGTGITGGTITTSGTLAIDTTVISTRAWRQKGIDSVASLPKVTSVGLTMPSAFNVSGSPVTSAGTLAVTGAGLTSQYVRGDGTLGDFPGGGGGGGASVSYYLNGSVNQGTFGGNTYYQMSKTPIFGTGTNFTINANGYIAQFITDAGNPGLLKIPGGNWNFETFFSASSGGGTPTYYVELYKYNGTTFTLIASGSTNPDVITGGTSVEAYFSTLPVPETILTLTDRLAVRIYVNHAGRTITLHTEDDNLCQIITTFTTGITALNGLTEQVQYFTTGTSGTDFNISSSVATHTFNLPTASATNRGALSTTDWSTFNSKIGPSDTASMLSPYLRKADTTAMLTNYVNNVGYGLSKVGKVVSADSSTLSNYYLRRKDSLTSTNLLGYVTRKVLADTAAAIRSSDAGGTVTSVATNNGTGITGGTITTSGTLAIDTTIISTRLWRQKGIDSVQANLTAGLATKLNISDTASMLSPYLRSNVAAATYVPLTRTITINGTSQDLSANRTFSVGTVTQVSSGYALSGGPITGSGTLSVDSSVLSSYYLRRKDSLTSTNLLGYVTRKVLADTAAAIRSSDAGGTVTSVATNTGTGITGGTITTSGTLAIDTALISTRLWRQKGIDSVQSNLTAGLALKVNISDTSSMLSPYLRKIDTTAMLSPYARKNFLNAGTGISYSSTTGTIANTAPDQTVALTGGTGISISGTYPNFTITNSSPSSGGTVTSVGTNNGTGIIGGTITTAGTLAIDTLLISTRAWRQKGVDSLQANINTKVNISDTASMLSPYLRSNVAAATYVPQSRTITINGTSQDLSANRTFSVGTVTSVGLTAGTGISVSGSPVTGSGSMTVTNTAPDQTVVLNSGTGISISGTYPNFTITNSSPSSGGTVTSVATNNGTGITGGTITGAGTLAIDTTLISTRLWRQKGVDSVAGLLSSYVPTSRTITINGTSQDLSANRTYSVGTVTSVGLSSATSGVTIGSTPVTSSGTITLAIATASGSQQGLLSSTDWTTFNNKQNALTNPVTGTGTTNYIPKFTSSSAIGNSQIFDNGTNVGINTTSPAATLDVNGTIYSRSASGIFSDVFTAYSGVDLTLVYGASGNLLFKGGSGAATRMTLNASGNLGLGVTPSAWSSGKAIEVGALGNSIWGAGGGDIALFSNAYYNSNFIYASSNYATGYRQQDGVHKWLISSSGTAGNAISFTQAMTLDASGNLGIGTTSPTQKLDVVISSGPYNTRFHNSSTSTSEYNIIAVTQGASGSATGYFGTGGSATSNTAFANTFVIGTQSNSAFVFNTNDFERMRITSGGNVGIGTTNPSQLLHIYSASSAYALVQGNGRNLYLGQDGTGAAIYSDGAAPMYFSTNAIERMRITSGGNVLVNTTTTSDAKLDVYNDASNYAAYFRANTLYAGGYRLMRWYMNGNSVMDITGDSSSISFNNNQSGFISFGTAGAERMRITSSGNVGIGTTSPISILTVDNGSVGNITSGFMMNMGSTNQGASAYGMVGINVYGGAGNSIYALRTGYQPQFIEFAWNDAMIFHTTTSTFTAGTAITGTEKMRITNAGNVGIGTTNPTTYKLQVDGAAGIVSTANAAIELGIRTPDATYNDSYLIFGTATNNRAQIQVTGSAANTGNMVFTTYNAGSGAERMRITSGGLVQVGQGVGNDAATRYLQIQGSGTTSAALELINYWNGNAYVSGVYGGKGTNAASNLLFKVGFFNGSVPAQRDAMFISEDANVGIGTTSPSNRLDVLGTAASPNLSGTNAYARFYQSGGYANITIGALASGSFAGWLQSSDGVGTALPLAINPSGGNVGIGTTNPSYQFQVNGSDASVALRSSDGTSEMRINAQSGIAILETITNTDLRIRTNSTEKMRITSGGYVGINEQTPNSYLHVKGSLRLPITTKTATYTLTADDYTVVFDLNGNATANLPDATTIPGRIYVIKINRTNVADTLTIDPNGAQTIDGFATYGLQCQYAVTIQSDGSNWRIISDFGAGLNCL